MIQKDKTVKQNMYDIEGVVNNRYCDACQGFLQSGEALHIFFLPKIEISKAIWYRSLNIILRHILSYSPNAQQVWKVTIA